MSTTTGRPAARRTALAAGLLLVVAAGCDILDPEPVVRRQFEVASFKSGCIGEGNRYCLLVRTPGTVDYQFMYFGPEGFSYEWGYEYTIAIEERENPRPPLDGSSIVRTLDRVVTKTPAAAGTTFSLNVPSEWVVAADAERFALLYEPVTMTCEGDCTGLEDASSSTSGVVLDLRFSGAPGSAYELLAWRPCEVVGAGACF